MNSVRVLLLEHETEFIIINKYPNNHVISDLTTFERNNIVSTISPYNIHKFLPTTHKCVECCASNKCTIRYPYNNTKFHICDECVDLIKKNVFISKTHEYDDGTRYTRLLLNRCNWRNVCQYEIYCSVFETFLKDRDYDLPTEIIQIISHYLIKLIIEYYFPPDIKTIIKHIKARDLKKRV